MEAQRSINNSNVIFQQESERLPEYTPPAINFTKITFNIDIIQKLEEFTVITSSFMFRIIVECDKK